MKYATVTSWANYFEDEEGVQISPSSIQRRLKKAKIIGITARGKMNRVLKNSFYSEADVRTACADILQYLPYADKNGFFELGSEKYATREVWATILFISAPTIRDKLKRSPKKSIKGKNRISRISNFYSESDIRSACADLLQVLPRSNKDNFFEKDGIKYGTIGAWSRVLSISKTTITSRLEQNKINGVKGKTNRGQIYHFYSEQDVRFICSNILEEVPQADEAGFFEKDGIKYGTIGAWSKILPTTDIAITPRLKQSQVNSIKGKAVNGIVRDFFSESDIHSACADVLQEVPQADEAGFFEKDGIKYGTIGSWKKVLPISGMAITRRLKQSQIKSIKGKDHGGQIHDFFSEIDILSICADLLQELPQADKTGFFEKDDIKYGTIKAWLRALSISQKSITRRLKQSRVNSIKGKDIAGSIRDFFSEIDILSICADLLEKHEK